MFDEIFARGPEPRPGDVLYYDQHSGILQAIKSESNNWTMPVSRDSEIIGYAYRNRTPEYMYQCQWVSIPYNGGPVHRWANTLALKGQLPRQIVTVVFNDTYEQVYKIGQMFAQMFSFALVAIPKQIGETHVLKLNIPLEHADSDKFLSEFNDIMGRQANLRFTATINPQTSQNWEYCQNGR